MSLILTLVPWSPVYAQQCGPLPPYAIEADRVGFNVVVEEGKGVFEYDTKSLGAGWFLDYRPSQFSAAGVATDAPIAEAAQVATPAISSHALMLPSVFSVAQQAHNMDYVSTLRGGDLNDNWESFVGNLVDQQSGMLLIVGNEPDRRGYQDDQTPTEYAKIYHDVYEFVKQRDPTVSVAIAGVVQPTPLRRIYLDKVLDEYQRMYGKKMPIDVWTTHAFILREVDPVDYPDNPYEVWGAGIPPGLEAYKSEAIKYNVNQHGDVEELKLRMIEFRQWMKDRGYRNTPLLVTEYGILMPPDYDAPGGGVYDYAFVTQFMRDTFDFFQTATNGNTGYPADGNRLVQGWSWFGLNNEVNGYLVEHDSGAVTQLGQDFSALMASYGAGASYSDVAMHAVSGSRSSVSAGKSGEKLTLRYSVVNRGREYAMGTRVLVWLGEPGPSGKLLASRDIAGAIAARCSEVVAGELAVTLPALTAGTHTITLVVSSHIGAPDAISDNNRMTLMIRALP